MKGVLYIAFEGTPGKLRETLVPANQLDEWEEIDPPDEWREDLGLAPVEAHEEVHEEAHEEVRVVERCIHCEERRWELRQLNEIFQIGVCIFLGSVALIACIYHPVLSVFMLFGAGYFVAKCQK
jgi:hypothetical protein